MNPGTTQCPRLKLVPLGGLRDRNVFLLVAALTEFQGGEMGPCEVPILLICGPPGHYEWDCLKACK